MVSAEGVKRLPTFMEKSSHKSRTIMSWGASTLRSEGLKGKELNWNLEGKGSYVEWVSY